MNKRIFLYVVALGVAAMYFWKAFTMPEAQNPEISDLTLEFPASQYPETAAHMKEAVAAGQSQVCTIARKEEDVKREEALKDFPAKEGSERADWPMAMCAEGGAGADVAYVTDADYRGANAWIEAKLENYPDGTRVEFVVK
ncbi:hypothetical protein FHS18_001391 [Paenibacillus phyllosphaerae]|uniref:Uncharacterized protein n=1 Tax=Paenibacillus phyllosphaerae TaxID=274593 RepID=A0A7W5AV40_9BACL|nr:hypothetical protein [Paenibacillus phyllosphaerae]MBB3109339.1 hypothetical protein [Paenibacillus phyllosphaerae]